MNLHISFLGILSLQLGCPCLLRESLLVLYLLISCVIRQAFFMYQYCFFSFSFCLQCYTTSLLLRLPLCPHPHGAFSRPASPLRELLTLGLASDSCGCSEQSPFLVFRACSLLELSALPLQRSCCLQRTILTHREDDMVFFRRSAEI